MKKFLMFSSVVVLFLLLSACVETYNKEEYEEVEDYSDEIIAESEIAIFALSDLEKKDFDSNEKLENPNEYIKKTEEINDKYWGDSRLSDIKESEMKEWRINMSRGEDEEWTIKGDELADAIHETKDSTQLLIDAYKETKKDNNDKNFDRLSSAINQTDDAIAHLKDMIYNKS